MTTTRRQFLRSATAAGVLLAASGRSASAQAPPMTKAARLKLTPAKALDLLMKGNARFVSGEMLERDLMAQVRATAPGQYPFAGVLGCIDSRVPPELVFDQGIGDIFSARVAGNFANTDFIGSFEFATKLAGAKLIVVLGHSECGAVKGACDNAQLGNLTSTLSNIVPAVFAVEGIPGERDSTNPAFVDAVARENVRMTVKALTLRSAILRDLAASGKIEIVGAMHDVATGRVSLLE